jgi:hypothetical protein
MALNSMASVSAFCVAAGKDGLVVGFMFFWFWGGRKSEGKRGRTRTTESSRRKNYLTFSPRRVELDDLVDDRGVAETLADGVSHDLRVAAAGCVV